MNKRNFSQIPNVDLCFNSLVMFRRKNKIQGLFFLISTDYPKYRRFSQSTVFSRLRHSIAFDSNFHRLFNHTSYNNSLKRTSRNQYFRRSKYINRNTSTALGRISGKDIYIQEFFLIGNKLQLSTVFSLFGSHDPQISTICIQSRKYKCVIRS